MTKKLSIDRIEWAEGPSSMGTRVILSDGSELAGVISSTQESEAGCPQYITVRVVKSAICGS